MKNVCPVCVVQIVDSVTGKSHDTAFARKEFLPLRGIFASIKIKSVGTSAGPSAPGSAGRPGSRDAQIMETLRRLLQEQ